MPADFGPKLQRLCPTKVSSFPPTMGVTIRFQMDKTTIMTMKVLFWGDAKLTGRSDGLVGKKDQIGRDCMYNSLYLHNTSF